MNRLLLLVTLLVLLTACSPAPMVTQPATEVIFTPASGMTATPFKAALATHTPAESPAQSATPTSAPTEPTVNTGGQARANGQLVNFETGDGQTLQGTLYGSGTTGILFLNMGDNHQASWSDLAEQAAQLGYLALTYNYRYRENGNVTRGIAGHLPEDVFAALDFLHQQGAQELVMAGASLGGMLAAKIAAEAQAVAVVIIASPMEVPSIGFAVDAAELQAITAPKLFITSENDHIVDPAALKSMYELAVEPKKLFVYPGVAHGTEIFTTSNGTDLSERLLDFFETNAPPAPN